MEINIQFNEKIIEESKKIGLYADHAGSSIFILFALYENKQKLLDKFDDFNKERRVIILYRQLERKGLIESTMFRNKYAFNITKKGIKFVEFIKEFQGIEIIEEIIKEKENFETFISEYISFFPKNLRDSSRNVKPRMEEFIKEFKNYDYDLILKATKMYISSQEDSEHGHRYTRRSIYFIYKGAGKNKIFDLATWCEQVKNNKPVIDTGMMDSV